jgi:hypothetical protein
VYKCSTCKKELKQGEQPCPYCGHIGRDISVVVNETIGITENLVTATDTKEYNFPWLLATIAVTISSPVITAYLDQQIGIIVGIASGGLAFWLGTRAYMQIKRITQSG